MNTSTNISSSKGPSDDDITLPDTNSSNHSHDDEDDPFTFRSRKSYPQRNNRPKLNYRDLERGYYDRDELRQSSWALGGPIVLGKRDRTRKSPYSDEDDDVEDTVDANDLLIEEKEKGNDEGDQMHRRLWCICKKPWDHSRLMLRCDSCANWYHGDCIGVSKEQARMLDMKNEQFVCPPCQRETTKSGRLSDQSSMGKRQRLDVVSSSDRRVSEPPKRPKTGIFFQREATEPQIHCIVHGCTNWAKSGWVYCSPACIRRHINETLQAIQRSKGNNNENPASREDILLYETRTKKLLDRKLVPKVEDLCTWINQHPSYEIVKPALRQSILLTSNESRSPISPLSARSPTPITPKSSVTPTAKSLPPKKTSNVQNTADIRSKVPAALSEKLIQRIKESGEKTVSDDEVRTVCEKIEEEMFRVFGKVDNSYKNKFRSLLSNITNAKNNYFYKQILSKEVTAKQIVAMKPEDMLPPEIKEKRKDEFEKEVQRIVEAGEQSAEEMARRAKMKVTRQGLVDNDIVLPAFQPKEESKIEPTEKVEETKPIEVKKSPSPIKEVPTIKPTEPSPPPVPTTVEKVPSPIQTSTSHDESSSHYSNVDMDNDYIEPESPTGIDALLYDDDDELNNSLNQPRSFPVAQIPEQSTINSDYLPPKRDDYNPLSASMKYQPTPINRSSSISPQWNGSINLPENKLLCQSVRVYGDAEYLIGDIPEQLGILGRLRLTDLWEYTRDSLPVRDVIILTLKSSNSDNNNGFVRYVDSMRSSGRAAVINKRTDQSIIRDMYILAADLKDCPSSVVSSLGLTTNLDRKHLFLVIIGAGKRPIKTNNFIYKPVSLQESSSTRDPRLLKNKDLKIPSESTTTMKSSITNDNLNEENMEMDDESDERLKKSTTHYEFNDVDYRFLDRDDRGKTSIINEEEKNSSIIKLGKDSDLRSKQNSPR